MKKTIIAMAFALAGPVLLAQQAETPAASADPVIMKAGSTEIRKSEFEHALSALPAEYQAFASGPGKRQFAEDYLRLRMLADVAQKEGLDKDPKVQSQLKLLRENTLANAQIERMRASVQLSDAELRKAYEERKETLERARARHILIAFEGSPAAPAEGVLSEEAARAKAEEIRTKIAGGADFAELAKTESHDTGSGASGGDLGEFGRGQMVPEFEQAVFGTEPGRLAPVVRTQFGYHVIEVRERTTMPLEKVRTQLEEQIRQEKLETLIEAMQGAANSSFSEDYFGSVPPPTPAPGG
ncbi:MAG TPA: peptidylprolyl isomerase [Thermoanaerobaculia bacterium]|nr:peptidylprolyl isomerase [Thermoanaerobaculia bacterium]